MNDMEYCMSLIDERDARIAERDSEIERLRAIEDRYMNPGKYDLVEVNEGGDHHNGCHQMQGHHDCALAYIRVLEHEIERLRSDNAALLLDIAALRKRLLPSDGEQPLTPFAALRGEKP